MLVGCLVVLLDVVLCMIVIRKVSCKFSPFVMNYVQNDVIPLTNIRH